MRSRLGDAKGERNKDQVYLIKKELTRLKNVVKMCLKIEDLKLKKMRR